jgi:glucokinase
MDVFLGVDWGGTYIKAGLVDSRGKILKKRIDSSKDLKKKSIFINHLESLLDSFKTFKVKAIGIGAPGIINTKKGFIYYLPNIPGWRNYHLGKILKKRVKSPIFIDNDANVFGLAESCLGAGKGKSRVIFLTLGTGLGGTVVIDGKLPEGDISALELGHVPIDLKGKLCGCGARGCIETFVGNKYLLNRYNKLVKGRKKAKEVKDIFARALKGEKCALIVWQEFSQAMGKFLAGMINIFSPQVIVFGGGVSGAFKLFKPLVYQTIKKQAMWPQLKGLKLVRAELKDAGIIGAALLAKEKLNSKQ